MVIGIFARYVAAHAVERADQGTATTPKKMSQLLSALGSERSH
ncbi:hypothetical protein ABZ249_16385 [Nocardiopsis sp. NPDC006139]